MCSAVAQLLVVTANNSLVLRDQIILTWVQVLPVSGPFPSTEKPRFRTILLEYRKVFVLISNSFAIIFSNSVSVTSVAE